MAENVIFYGAGTNMKNLLTLFDACSIPFDYPIWDVDAEEIRFINGHKVSLPDFDNRVENKKAVVAVDDNSDVASVAEKLRSIGFETIRGKSSFLDFTETPKSKFLERCPVEYTDFERELNYCIRADGLTMTASAKLYATLSACRYAVQNNIEGDFVECGVWRGGHCILAASIFKHYGSNKKVWLYDTFEGFINAGIKHSVNDDFLIDELDKVHETHYNTDHCGNSLNDVKKNFSKYGVLNDNVMFVKGDVNVTLDSKDVPKQISVLRMDTDLYESTRKQLQVLYPRLSKHGVLLEDDYDYVGVRSAIDEYFDGVQKPLFQYIDHGGRLAIKTT